MKRFLTIAGLTLTFAMTAASAQGVTVTIACGSVGQDFDQCKKGADIWANRTGNKANVLQVPQGSSNRLALYQQQLAARSPDVDVYHLDVVWPGLLSQHFIDLKPHIPAAQLNQHFPSIVANNTVNGKLVGVPWYTDAGLLYYRTDLLEKYGYNAPPKTWAELNTMARRIQQGERASNPNFAGYVFQAKAYEGLTCNALEWLASHGGGTIVNAQGNVTVNNPRAVAALNTAKGMVGTIAPTGVTTYGEEEARAVWQAGNSAFMRNWPYAYSLSQQEGSPIRGKFSVAPLPAGPNGKSAACLGGWQLGVSNYSRNKEAATDLVRYLTSAEEQKRRAIEASYNPTIPALYRDPQVLAAQPFFGTLANVFANTVARPATITGDKYNQVSSAFYTSVYNVLTDRATAANALRDLEGQLNRIKGRGW